MLKSERKQVILEELKQHKIVSKLVGLLDTSESTVRRDLDELSLKINFVECMEERFSLLARRRNHSRKICQKPSREEVDCSKSIFPHQRKMLSLWMQEVRQPFSLRIGAKDITVVTNSIHHAVQLVDKQIPTVIIGGESR